MKTQTTKNTTHTPWKRDIAGPYFTKSARIYILGENREQKMVGDFAGDNGIQNAEQFAEAMNDKLWLDACPWIGKQGPAFDAMEEALESALEYDDYIGHTQGGQEVLKEIRAALKLAREGK